MPRKDTYHEAVRIALEKEGWTITDDPLTVQAGNKEFYIDLGAEIPVIGAEKDGRIIAIEVKSLIGRAFIFDFYQSLGQFLVYRHALEKSDPKRVLYLAIPQKAHTELAQIEIFQEIWNVFSVNLLIFDAQNHVLMQWIKN
ncbi:MAG: element excision factor XisH family protein [Saprospiraceae bacterium]